MEIKTIEELARVMKENDLAALEVREEGMSVKLKRMDMSSPLSGLMGGASQRPAAPFVPAAAGSVEQAAPAPAPAKKEGSLVLSPTVGVFYSAPSPESRDFVAVGDQVKKGDTLCIIEAMKLMNEIPSELDGTVVEICASSGQVVEYNQPLFRII